jgi:type IV secretion system protein TrbL
MGIFSEAGQRGDSPSSGRGGGLGTRSWVPACALLPTWVASAKGSMDATKAHLSGGERANQTPSGKVASAIRANMDQPEFKGNKFAGSTDTTLEPDAVAFVNSK